jgi:hypothetical protein
MDSRSCFHNHKDPPAAQRTKVLLPRRLALAPVARLVFCQERREGDLRYAHVRLRQYAAEVAQYGAQRVERRHLDASLAAALENQARGVLLDVQLGRQSVVTCDRPGYLLPWLPRA